MNKVEEFAAAFELEEIKINSRFLEEVEALKTRNEISSAREFTRIVNVHNSFISEIKTGRYKVNIRILWTAKKCFPAFDADYVLWGVRSGRKKKAT